MTTKNTNNKLQQQIHFLVVFKDNLGEPLQDLLKKQINYCHQFLFDYNSPHHHWPASRFNTLHVITHTSFHPIILSTFSKRGPIMLQHINPSLCLGSTKDCLSFSFMSET